MLWISLSCQEPLWSLSNQTEVFLRVRYIFISINLFNSTNTGVLGFWGDAVAVSEVVEVGAWAAETVSDALAVSETADVNA